MPISTIIVRGFFKSTWILSYIFKKILPVRAFKKFVLYFYFLSDSVVHFVSGTPSLLQIYFPQMESKIKELNIKHRIKYKYLVNSILY